MRVDINERPVDINTLSEAIGHFYKGKIIQVYWGESGGSTKYSDYDVSQNMFLEGKVLWGRGHAFAIEITHETNQKKYTKQVIFNEFSVTMVAEKTDELDITAIFSGRI